MYNSTFSNNSAHLGAALYLKDAKIGQYKKCNITFSDNKVSEGGRLKETPSKLAIYYGFNGSLTLLNT